MEERDLASHPELTALQDATGVVFRTSLTAPPPYGLEVQHLVMSQRTFHPLPRIFTGTLFSL
jgi:hypothetical protein